MILVLELKIILFLGIYTHHDSEYVFLLLYLFQLPSIPMFHTILMGLLSNTTESYIKNHLYCIYLNLKEIMLLQLKF